MNIKEYKKQLVAEHPELAERLEREKARIHTNIRYKPNSGNIISDGYHTFGELYEHRIVLYIALCRILAKLGRANVWRSKKHSDGRLIFKGKWFVLGLQKQKGNQITYHLPIEKWSETDFAENLKKAPEFDGHTSDDVIERIKNII